MPGFDFSNHTRNAALHARGVPLPKATSTGTTIVGCIFEGGVVVSYILILPSTNNLNASSFRTYTQTTMLIRPYPDRSRYQSYQRTHSSRQGTISITLRLLMQYLLPLELRETPLHCTSNLVCRCRYSCRYRIHNRPHLFTTRAPLVINRS